MDLVRTIELRTIAEGCETWEQWRAIVAAGCDGAQGWLISRAVDPIAAESFLRHPWHWQRSHLRLGASPIEKSRDAADTIVAKDEAAALRRVIIDGDGLNGRDVFFAAFKLSRMPMTLVDPHLPDMPVVFVNEAFERLTLYDPAEILGRNCRFLQGADTDPEVVKTIRDALSAPREVSVELVNYRKDGSSFWNVLHISPVFDGSGRLRFFFGSQRDITRRKWT